MKKERICILGGTGFVGSHLIHRLSKTDASITVVTRHRERHRNLLIHPDISLVEADIHDEDALENLFQHCDVVINLVGILNPKGSTGSFEKVHVELAQKVVTACNRTGVQRLLHMSALQAGSVNAISQYLRSKGEGENHAHLQAGNALNVTSFRPSVIFGEGDHLFNKFATMLRLPLLTVPLACPEARFAPIYAQDVAEVFIQAIHNPGTYGKRYDLCGPREYTLMDLMEFTERCIGVRRLIVGLSNSLSRLQAKVLGRLPGKIMTLDNYRSMRSASTCEQPLDNIFDIELTPMESIVPGYLGRKNQQVNYMNYRMAAKR